jgi:hypothetical protein
VEAKLKRLYDAIENGIADVSDPMLKERVTELKAIRDQARADAERAAGALDRLGPSVTPQALKTFANQARGRMRTESGGYRRDHLRALPSAWKWTRKRFASWGRKAYCFARSSLLQAQKRRVLQCPVLYRGGAPFRIKLRTLMLLKLRYNFVCGLAVLGLFVSIVATHPVSTTGADRRYCGSQWQPLSAVSRFTQGLVGGFGMKIESTSAGAQFSDRSFYFSRSQQSSS